MGACTNGFLILVPSFHILYGLDSLALPFVSYRLKMDCCKAVLPERSHIPGLLTICWRLPSLRFAGRFCSKLGLSAGLNAL